MADCYGYQPFLLALGDNNGELLSGLPVIELKSAFSGKRWISLPFTDYCSPLVRDGVSQEIITEALIDLRRKYQLSSFEVRSALLSKDIHLKASYVVHSLTLQSAPEILYENFDRKFRQYPRKAERAGLHVISTNTKQDVQHFYEIHLKTRVKLGVPIQPKHFFDLLWDRIISQGLGEVILVADRNEKPISGAVILHYKKNAMIKYSASDPSYLDTRCHYFTFWKCIEWACLNGMSVIDFGKTDVPEEGLRKFKDGWGAVERPLNYSFIADSPPKPSANPLMKPLKMIIRHSPPWVCRVIGELFYKYAA